MDNKSIIDLVRHPSSHGRSKHIETKYYFIREQVSKGCLNIGHYRSKFQLAKILTKPLKFDRFSSLRNQIGVVSVKALAEGGVLSFVSNPNMRTLFCYISYSFYFYYFVSYTFWCVLSCV